MAVERFVTVCVTVALSPVTLTKVNGADPVVEYSTR